MYPDSKGIFSEKIEQYEAYADGASVMMYSMRAMKRF